MKLPGALLAFALFAFTAHADSIVNVTMYTGGDGTFTFATPSRIEVGVSSQASYFQNFTEEAFDSATGKDVACGFAFDWSGIPTGLFMRIDCGDEEIAYDGFNNLPYAFCGIAAPGATTCTSEWIAGTYAPNPDPDPAITGPYNVDPQFLMMVTEPSTFILTLLGIVALGFGVRKRVAQGATRG
jgi:hypothetical protein